TGRAVADRPPPASAHGAIHNIAEATRPARSGRPGAARDRAVWWARAARSATESHPAQLPEPAPDAPSRPWEADTPPPALRSGRPRRAQSGFATSPGQRWPDH